METIETMNMSGAQCLVSIQGRIDPWDTGQASTGGCFNPMKGDGFPIWVGLVPVNRNSHAVDHS